ncbi:MAG TPA: 30S ribosomal protein THX [Bacteroidales bacterium]|jgi:ribosomal small subunit protein bTHX|nr:30S ribosomal protein THX [Bacteroidales bacterium]
MGKGDKKTRRGKIIIGSNGVRRPANKPKAYVAPEMVAKLKKTTEKPKAEAKPKVKVAETAPETGPETVVAETKTVKKTVKKVKSAGETE